MMRVVANKIITIKQMAIFVLISGLLLPSYLLSDNTVPSIGLSELTDDQLQRIIYDKPITPRAQPPKAKLFFKNVKNRSVAVPVVRKPIQSNAMPKRKNQPLTLTILGVDGLLHENAEAHLPVFRPDCYALHSDIKRFSKLLTKKMKSSMRALGYYDTRIEIKASTMAGCWNLKVIITKNEPIKIRYQAIKVSIDEGETIPELLHKIVLKKPYDENEILNHKQYNDYKSHLSDAAQASGYLNYRFITKQLRIDKKKHTADVVIHLVAGKRFSFGDVLIEQDKVILKGKYLDRFIQLKKGQHYTTEALIRQQQLLQNSGYYKVVKVEASHQDAYGNVVPVKIKLIAKKRNAYKFKLGYATDTGIHFKGEMERRWLGQSGHRLNISAGLSEHVNQVQARLTIPKDNPEDNNSFYTMGWKRDTKGDVISNAYNIGVVATTKYDNGWQRTLSIKYLDDKIVTASGDSSHARLTLFGFKFAKIQADDRLYPKNGWRLSLEAQGAMDEILSDATVLQLRVKGKYIKQIGAGRLIIRSDIGTIVGEDIEDLPKDLRFFAGGVNSVRGYNPNELGGVDDNGDVVGGRHLLTGSLEYEYPINDEWGVAAFVDAGNAFDDWGNMDLQVGYGVGARWRSPIGPVRVDVAIPQSDPSDVHLHLSIGADL